MASRPLIIASLLGASIGVPYFAAFPPAGAPSSGDAPPPAADAAPTAKLVGPIASAPDAPPLPATHVAPAPESPRFHSVEQFLRFDVTKEWLYRHWKRKSTGPTDVGLFSVRVPLVMGTHPTALAGSLTYYFNSHGQVEHISFHGRTADTSQLVRFLVRTYEFEPVEGPVGEQVYQVKRRGRAQSELRTRTESVLDSSAAHRSIAVELELARPGTRRFLPPRGPFLNIPAVSTPPATLPSQSAAAAEAAGDSYLDRVRYANPGERDQFLWRRWPN